MTASGAAEPVSEIEKGRITTDNFSVVGERVIHQGAVVTFFEAEIEDKDGARFDRDLVRHPGAVAVVPIIEGEVLLVQQYRAALDADLIEIPAGKRDVAGEPPIETAHRELEEEVGMRAGTMVPLINVHHSPGFCDEYGHIFLATDLVGVPQRREGPEEQVMTIHRTPLAEAVEMCLDGRITDAKTVAALLAASHRLSTG